MSRSTSRFVIVAFLMVTLQVVPWQDMLGLSSTTTTGTSIQRITGIDTEPCDRWRVCATDLGIPFEEFSGRGVAYLFGDTFVTRNPEDPGSQLGWRSPVMLHSSETPARGSQIRFDGAAGLTGDGTAPEIIAGGHENGQITYIPNDGISFPETGEQVISYQSVRSWNAIDGQLWQTNYSGLAWSSDGNTFQQIGPIWHNDEFNNDPFQMVSMQRDGDYVYMVSVRAGRQQGPMMLRRVPWQHILDASAYECWDGSGWNLGTCQPILEGTLGEPSLRLLGDTWAMAYLDLDTSAIVTRTAQSPQGPWSAPKVQLSAAQYPCLYGGFIHPRSTPDDLILMVSIWQRQDGQTLRYDVSQVNGTL